MNFIEIDMEQWVRKEHYNHYSNHVPCSFSTTVDIDISDLVFTLKSKGIKAYPLRRQKPFLLFGLNITNTFKNFIMLI